MIFHTFRRNAMDDRYSELVPLHDALKEIVKDFDAICSRAEVSFFLVYGTMLGAARHQDIIPWDDDVDLGMLRDDYEKLILFFQHNKVENYSLYCAETDSKHTQIFAKLVRNDGKYDYLSKFYTHHAGLSVDIFPLDEALPQSKVRQRIRGAWIVHLRRIVNSRAKLANPAFHEKTVKRVCRFLMVLPFLVVDNHKLLEHTNDLCRRGNGKGYPNIISYSTTDKLYKENDPREDWLPAAKLPLGVKQYCVPARYEKILTHIYGEDWNEIPPESIREQHSHLGE